MDIINIPSTRKKITVDLVGVKYVIMPPKAVLAIEMAKSASALKDAEGEQALQVLEPIYEWLGMCFESSDLAKIKKRLMSRDDDLDLPHIMILLEKLTEIVSGDPTTSSSDSSDS